MANLMFLVVFRPTRMPFVRALDKGNILLSVMPFVQGADGQRQRFLLFVSSGAKPPYFQFRAENMYFHIAPSMPGRTFMDGGGRYRSLI